MEQAYWIKLGQVTKPVGLLEMLRCPVWLLFFRAFIILADHMFLGRAFTWQVLRLIKMSMLIGILQLKTYHVEMKARGRKKGCLTAALF